MPARAAPAVEWHGLLPTGLPSCLPTFLPSYLVILSFSMSVLRNINL